MAVILASIAVGVLAFSKGGEDGNANNPSL